MPRCIGLDLHKRVLEVCILDQAGRIEARHRVHVDRDTLVAFADHELRADDRLAVETTTNTWPVVELLRPYVGEIVVSNPMATKAIAHAKVKTDKVDARMLAQLLRADFLPSVWQPDDDTARLRQLTGQRASLVADRIGMKNRIHAVLHQRLIPLPSERLFSQRGRQWLDQRRSMLTAGPPSAATCICCRSSSTPSASWTRRCFGWLVGTAGSSC
jgi:transposase